MRSSLNFRRIQKTIRKKLFLLEKGSGMTFLLANFFERRLSISRIIKMGHEMGTSL